MAKFKVNKTKNYTIMSNYHLKEKNMSLKAKGLLSVMLSLPNDWDYSITGLVAISQENETAIKSALYELKRFGYLEVIKLMPNESKNGRIDYIYNVYEKPKQEVEKQGVEKQGVENQGVEKQGVEKQGVENQGQLNTNNKYNNINIINTKKQNIDNNKKDINKLISKKDFVKPNVEDVRKYCVERQNSVDAEKFVDFYEAKGWMIGKNKMKDWKACVRTWERKQKNERDENQAYTIL